MEYPAKNDERGILPYDIDHFKLRKEQGENLSAEAVFEEIYQSNFWQSAASVSGPGSDQVQTAEIAKRLPELLKSLNIKTMLDAPCGDFAWLSNVDLGLENYLGADIVADLIAQHNAQFASENRRFLKLNLIEDPLPAADLLFCRDCLVHLSFDDIFAFLKNLRQSPIRWLLTTTFPERSENQDIATGDWRVLNFEKPPFSFPPPHLIINEKCTEADGAFSDKSLGLWGIEDLNI